MPPLPQISSERLIKALEHLGFTRRAGKGSHTVMRRGSVVCVVPHRSPVPKGTLANVLRQAGVTADQLMDAM
ncbi:type II toxin-antitoxin system HicA family toxin [Streptomyces sp. NPDC050636]|uniref:type II toxin-antitoxin system HicA family toxin n=1 Tax=Streptomyces sp. NPDC050636 TaxID=3154510 RepID=UPI003416BA9D